MADEVNEGNISLERALGWHLEANHYPPVPSEMIPVAVAAIRAAQDEEWEADIFLPDGVTYRGRFAAPAFEIVETYHLESFIGLAEDEEE
jgi:hypothetical protein